MNVMHLNPETIPSPPLLCGKIVFHETGPWCPEAWVLRLQTTLLSSVRQTLLGVPLSWLDPLHLLPKPPPGLGIPSPTRSRELVPLSPRTMDAAWSEPTVVPCRLHP